MNQLTFILICLSVFIQSSYGQNISKREIYNKEFKWTISIPENFEKVSAEDWLKMQNRGKEAIEKTYDEEVINETKTIFVFKSDELNYFESNYQPFDPDIDGDYDESCEDVNEILYQTFITQLPGIKIDTSRSVEIIDNLEFQTFKIKVEYPNNMVLNVLMYSRLFDKRDFTVNIMYVDTLKGEQMLNAWKKSKFAK